ncbi:MerR family transcriptional regulator [Umezawaea tangerina]|uniref:DNA-binding transcriptional MerR regulator n=1 Tax=Umezawaea tangerina TaxID=84725 RepID=A0A2T0SZH1_9PSEU|nr:helix-turn-helix domain-containing protein [Umezawaea tangerina]PRY38815.1 DNA-binding transcriptional MerR regulator [Umezawaea tangerina]
MELVSIGEFSRLSRLSAKALRLYDELGLLVPARVDAETGYRWYSAGQLERAGLVAALRRIGIPLARVKELLALDPAAAAEEIRAHWAGTEAEHAARRRVVGGLVERLHEEESEMDEVEVRDVPARSVVGMVRRVRQEELVPTGRELFIHRLRGGGVARVDGIAGAPFMIYHGEVGGDSDGPVEWCWPVPDDGAEEVAARFPDLTVRREAAHQEAFIRQGAAGRWDSAAQAEQALRSLAAWVVREGREPAGALRMVLVPNAGGERTGPDGEFAVPLR